MSAGHGTATLVKGTPLPRANKAALELYIGGLLLRRLAPNENLSINGVRSNPDDPPDVLFHLGGQARGLEIAELVPDNRFGRDAIIRRIKEGVLKQLELSEKTQDWVVTIMLLDDYAPRIRMPPPEIALASTLNSFFGCLDARAKTTYTVPVPEKLQHFIRLIQAQWWDLNNEPRITRRAEPLIIFAAQHTNVVPDRDFPPLISDVVRTKALHDLAVPTWLLLWSAHYAFGPLQDQLVKHIEQYLQGNPTKHERIFYVHHHTDGGITEFLAERPGGEGRPMSA